MYFDAASQDGPHTVDFGHFWPIGTQKLTPRTSACALWARKCCGQWVNSLLNTHISQSNHLAARDFIAFPPTRPKPAKSGPGPESRRGRHTRPRHRCMLASVRFKTQACARASSPRGCIMHASPATSHHRAYGTVQGAYCLIRHGAHVPVQHTPPPQALILPSP